MSDEVYLTRAGYEKMHSELDNLKAEMRRLSKVIEAARLQGDLSENAEYDAAKEAQGYIAARLADTESKLTKVRIIEDENIPSDRVYIGAIVSLKDLNSEEEFKYMMVSAEEADFDDNKVSIHSPIGQGLMGQAEGAEVEIQAPAGIQKYQILKIERP